MILNLASGFADAGYSVDLLVGKMKGALLNQIPSNINVVQLKAASSLRGVLSAIMADPVCLGPVMGALVRSGKVPGTFKSMPAIVRYFEVKKPAALLSALPKSNINAVLAIRRCSGATRIVIGVHTYFSADSELYEKGSGAISGYMLSLIRRCYRRADKIVAVSKGAAENVCEYLDLPDAQVTSIYNPIATSDIRLLREKTPDHLWYEPGGAPVILGIGRFVVEKDFPLLLDTFARIRQQRNIRLILLGGDAISREQRHLKQELLEQAKRLGIDRDIDMPGFVDNPFSFLNKAAMFVLSSRHEGFGNVLVEALLCGCPVVSTNCPGGPAEILENGKYGELVPVGDVSLLAEAILRTLDAPHDKDFLRTRGEEFSIDEAVDSYRRILLGGQ